MMPPQPLCSAGGHLSLGLTNVFDARAGDEQPQLRVVLIAIGPHPREREPRVGGVELRDDIALLHAVPFGDAQLEQRAADLRRDLDVGGFDLPRDAHAIGGRLLRARQRRGGDRGEE